MHRSFEHFVVWNTWPPNPWLAAFCLHEALQKSIVPEPTCRYRIHVHPSLLQFSLCFRIQSWRGLLDPVPTCHKTASICNPILSIYSTPIHCSILHEDLTSLTKVLNLQMERNGTHFNCLQCLQLVLTQRTVCQRTWETTGDLHGANDFADSPASVEQPRTPTIYSNANTWYTVICSSRNLPICLAQLFPTNANRLSFQHLLANSPKLST